MTALENLYQTQEFARTYDHAESPALPDKLSHYRFVSCLAGSEQKKTWVLEKPTGQRVLCKYASGEYADMLRTESEFFTLGKFPFVPYVYDYFETSDGAYLLREYVEGQTLSELVEKEGPLPLEKAVSLIIQLCGHLSRFHAANPPIIYRDLKPSNIVLQPSSDCYLIDLGTVRTYHEDSSADTVFIGTSETAAPEQFGARQTDARTDIYALGILFYYLLTGELKIQESSLKKLPSKAARVIMRCTAFDPKDRYSDVSMVISALHGSDRKGIRRKVVSIINCAVIFALIVLATVLLLPKSAGSQEVVFSSSLMEQAVRSAVGKADDETVYEQDLESITHLYICGNEVFNNPDDYSRHEKYHHTYAEPHGYGDIKDITLLEKMPNLRIVVLDYQQIYDISPLQDLELMSLSLCGNPITNLSCLHEQKALTELQLARTGVTSLEDLKGCSALAILNCSYTSVVSTKPLTSLPIRVLYLMNTPIADWEGLSTLPLEELFVSHVAAADYAYIASVPTIRHLTLSRCGIKSLNEITVFKNIALLDVDSNLITDLDGVEHFPKLEGIYLGGNAITDLSALVKINTLTSIGMPNGIMDFSFLNEMPQVQWVSILSQQLPALYEAVPEPWFTLEVYS